MERVVLYQLQNHLIKNQLLDINQSAYKHHHSTETALLHVLEGLLTNADQKLLSVLALLDLSAAFDTINHKILIKRFQISFGIEGTVLHWFLSYLEGRKSTCDMTHPCCIPVFPWNHSLCCPLCLTQY